MLFVSLILGFAVNEARYPQEKMSRQNIYKYRRLFYSVLSISFYIAKGYAYISDIIILQQTLWIWRKYKRQQRFFLLVHFFSCRGILKSSKCFIKSRYGYKHTFLYEKKKNEDMYECIKMYSHYICISLYLYQGSMVGRKELRKNYEIDIFSLQVYPVFLVDWLARNENFTTQN